MSITLHLELTWDQTLFFLFLPFYKTTSAYVFCFFVGEGTACAEEEARNQKSDDRNDHEDDMGDKVAICDGWGCDFLAGFRGEDEGNDEDDWDE